MDEEYITFQILNEQFTIKTDVEKEYLLGLADYLEKKILAIKQKIPTLSNIKAVIFAAIDIIDELNKEKKRKLDPDAVKLLSDLSDSLAAVIEEDE